MLRMSLQVPRRKFVSLINIDKFEYFLNENEYERIFSFTNMTP